MKSIDELREAATYNPAFSDNATRIVCNYLSEIEAEIAENYMCLPVDADERRLLHIRARLDVANNA